MRIVPFDLIDMRKSFDIAKGPVVMFRRTPCILRYLNKSDICQPNAVTRGCQRDVRLIYIAALNEECDFDQSSGFLQTLQSKNMIQPLIRPGSRDL